MQVIELINIVLDNLPEEIALDSLFLENIKEFLNVSDEAWLIGKVAVSEDLFEVIKNKNHQILEQLEITKKNKVLRLCCIDNEVGYTLDISFVGQSYIMLLKVTEPNKEIEISIDNQCLKRRFEKVEKVWQNDVCDNFSCEIKYYDQNNNIINADTEKEKDIIFSEEFLVPIEASRFLRTNFTTFKNFINKNLGQEKMNEEDNNLSEEEIFLFSKPFRITEFKEFIRASLEEEMILDYLALGYDVSNVTSYPLPRETLIDNIGSNLAAEIGDGEVIISNNILENISFVLYGHNGGIIYTKGFILKKMDNYFILYYVLIENDKIILMPETIDEEQAQILFRKNKDNENIEGLSEFLNIPRGR